MRAAARLVAFQFALAEHEVRARHRHPSGDDATAVAAAHRAMAMRDVAQGRSDAVADATAQTGAAVRVAAHAQAGFDQLSRNVTVRLNTGCVSRWSRRSA